MPKGPNSFFVPPDSEMIVNGTIYSSHDATGLYPTTCVAASANSGSMSSFVIGTPSSNTTYQLKIQDSGSNYSGTFIQRLSTATGSDSTLVWHGEPDRRHMWDIHNPLLKNYSTFFSIFPPGSPPANFYWENALKDSAASNIQGIYFSVLDKEFIYVSQFENNMPRLYVASRSIRNYETAWTKEAEITTLATHNMPLYNLSALDANKRGMEDAYEPVFSVCEHIDGKLRLAVKYNEEIDIYESSDGVAFTLIAKNIMSRFIEKRFLSHLKIASSGPYLKIAFVVGGTTIKGTPDRWLGGIVSSDGGATWTYTDVADSLEDGGAGIPVHLVNGTWGNYNYSYDLCGVSDGSGKFILAASGDILEEAGIGAVVQSEINVGDAYGGYIRFYVSSANARFHVKKQMGVPNILQSGKPFLATNNDWIWLVVAGSYNPVKCGWEALDDETSTNYGSFIYSKYCGTYYSVQNGLNPNSQYMESTRENAMFYLRIDADLDVEQWIPLGDSLVEPGNFNTTSTQRINQASGRTTGALGSYFFTPSSGSLYSCGPHMSFCSIGRSTNSKSSVEDGPDSQGRGRLAQYYRFSGWILRPPYINLGMNNVYQNNLKMIEAFVHQEHDVLSVPEFNYIWGKPAEDDINGNQISRNTLWSFRKEGTTLWSALRDDGIHFVESSAAAVSYQCNFYYFRCPVVADAQTWSSGAGQAFASVQDSDLRYPMFPIPMVVRDTVNSPECSWFQRKAFCSDAAIKPPGCCIQFVFGGVTNGSASRNSIGMKINSFTKGNEVPYGITDDAFLYEFFLRMDQTTLTLCNTSDNVATSYYREGTAVSLVSVTASGGSDFSDAWWEGKLSFLPDTDSLQNRINLVLSVRQLGTETWIDSTVYSNFAKLVGKGKSSSSVAYKFLGIQGLAFGLFPDSASTVSRKVSFRSVKICQGSDMTHLQMILNNSNTDFPPEANLIRGRRLAPNPIYLGAGQEVAWGGIGGKFGDLFDTRIKSSYEAQNTIKVSSPRFEYRTKGSDTADIKSSTAQIIYQLPDATRTSNSLSGYALFHTGIGLINTNAGTIKIEYADAADFASPYNLGQTSLNLTSGRVTAASNNRITVDFTGDALATRSSNNTQYTSTTNESYYVKFTALSGGVATTLLNKSYRIVRTSGNNVVLDVPDRDFSNATYNTIAGTSIDIYSDRIVARYGAIPDKNKYMRITLSNHLGTTDYLKLGSLVAGITFGLERVPINWEHSMDVAGNLTEFNSRSGVRWAYQEGPSVKTFAGTIEGDVFDEERDNIMNISEQATRFNAYPVALVFDGDRGKAFDSVGDDSGIRAHIDSTNMLYGTINNALNMVNQGWRYDSANSEWKVVGDLQLTVIEVV
mgnify:CR=1 FL=1